MSASQPIEFLEPDYGIVIPGTGPAGVLTIFTIPVDRVMEMFFFFQGYSDGGSAFGCYYNCTFDNDTGAPVEIGTATKTVRRGATAGDWDIFVEPHPGSATEIRVRAVGTAASQVRWGIRDGGVFVHAPPSVAI